MQIRHLRNLMWGARAWGLSWGRTGSQEMSQLGERGRVVLGEKGHAVGDIKGQTHAGDVSAG